MQKDKGFMPAFILCVIVLVTTTLLAFTNQITFEPRLALEAATVKANQLAMFPDASEFKPMELARIQAELPGVASVDLAVKDGKNAGVLIQAKSRGYGGNVPVLVAFDLTGKITNLKILSNDETPGLGKKVEDKSFFGQFIGKMTDKPFTIKADETDKTRIDAIAGATISSRAVNEAMNQASSAFRMVASEVK